MSVFNPKRGAFFLGEASSFGELLDQDDLTYIKAESVEWQQGAGEFKPYSAITQDDVEEDGVVTDQPGERGFTFPVCPIQATWPTGPMVFAGVSAPGMPWKAVLGNANAGGYGQAEAGSTVTSIVLGTGQGASFRVGQPVGIRTGGSLGPHMLWPQVVKSISGDTLTLRGPVPVAPAEGDVVFGTEYYWRAGASDPTPDYNACWAGQSPVDVRLGIGGVISSASMELTPRGFANLKLQFKFAKLYDPDQAVALGYTGAPETQTWSHPDAVQVVGGSAFLWDGVSLIKLDGGCSFDFGIQSVYNEGWDQRDPNGIREIVVVARRIRVKLAPAYRDNDLLAMFRNPPPQLMLTGSFGVGAKTFMYQIPVAKLVAPVGFGERENFLTSEIELGCGGYSGDTDTVVPSPACNAPFVCGWICGPTA